MDTCSNNQKLRFSQKELYYIEAHEQFVGANFKVSKSSFNNFIMYNIWERNTFATVFCFRLNGSAQKISCMNHVDTKTHLNSSKLKLRIIKRKITFEASVGKPKTQSNDLRLIWQQRIMRKIACCIAAK